jgi:hypothetical protein
MTLRRTGGGCGCGGRCGGLDCHDDYEGPGQRVTTYSTREAHARAPEAVKSERELWRPGVGALARFTPDTAGRVRRLLGGRQ